MRLLSASLLLLCLCGLEQHAYGFPFGGQYIMPACKDMMPRHGVASQTSAPPYTITTDIDATAGYTPGTTYTVTLHTTNLNFLPRGFLIIFRNYDNYTTAGTFMTMNDTYTTTGNCDRWNDAATHLNPSRETLPAMIQFAWTAPPRGTGPVRIWSTFLHLRIMFWARGYISNMIPEANSVGPPTTPMTPTPVTIDLSVCGSTKGCYRVPTGCTSQSTCAYIYTQQVGTAAGQQYIEVELSTTNAGWVAIGYSGDKLMGGADVSPPDDILACQNSGSVVQVKNGYIQQPSTGVPLARFHQLDNATNVAQFMTTLGSSYNNGVLACRFRRNLNTGGALDKNLLTSFYHFYGYDPTPGGRVAALVKHVNTPVVSTSMIAASSVNLQGNATGNAAALTSSSLAIIIATAIVFFN